MFVATFVPFRFLNGKNLTRAGKVGSFLDRRACLTSLPKHQRQDFILLSFSDLMRNYTFQYSVNVGVENLIKLSCN